MSAIETLERLVLTEIPNSNLKFCFVRKSKVPVRVDGVSARINVVEDFVDFDTLLDCERVNRYAGIGISIQASDICAIDIDDCCPIANSLAGISKTTKSILDMFGAKTYCEFSFSGHGIRILFQHWLDENYSKKYYIKNSSNRIEFYQPSQSFRYVTVTGNYISNLPINKIDESVIYKFLDTYMRKQIKEKRVVSEETETRSLPELLLYTKYLYMTNSRFQELWFGKAPGSGKDESERDFQLIALIFENITQDRDMVKAIFEESNFFKSKDSKHIYKWENQDFRYFDYIYKNIAGG